MCVYQAVSLDKINFLEDDMIRIGTRDSLLAAAQARAMADALEKNGQQTELIFMKTKGDRILDQPLSQIGGKGLFVAELEDALKKGEVDLIVHSMKDLPSSLAKGFPVVAASKREDPCDALVLPRGVYRLDRSKPFGTSSARRAAALRRLYPGCSFVPIRGNLQTRLRKLDESGEYCALILAAAGLKRLDLGGRISRIFTPEEMVPAAGQGILAIQAAADFDVSLLDGFTDSDALLAGTIEREFVRRMSGDCASPIGAYCCIDEEKCTLTGFNGLYSLSETAARADAGTLAQKLAAAFAKRGEAVLVGAGPGDEGLLTIAGREALMRCDAVLYDSLSTASLLRYAPEHALKVYVGKRSGVHSAKQEEINEQLCGYVSRGLQVVRLKGGDPFVFGRGGEELLALKERGLSARVIPGVTSAIAAAECEFIPVTHREIARSFHVITAHEKNGTITAEEAKRYAVCGGTLVFLMGVAAAGAIEQGLLSGGARKDTPCAVIENGTLPSSRSIRCALEGLQAAVKEHGIKSPAVILVGEVCGLQERMLPSVRKKAVVTRQSEKFSGMEDALRRAGIAAYRYPCIRVERNSIPEDFSERLTSADLLVFTSDAGAAGFFDWIAESGTDLRRLYGKKFAVIGERTKATLKQRGFTADIVPVKAGGKYLAEEIAMLMPRDRNVWLLQAEKHSAELKRGLLEGGYRLIAETAVYKVEQMIPDAQAFLSAVLQGEIGAITFTSGSCVKGFAGSFPSGIPAEVLEIPAVCIGPTASKAAAELGFMVRQAADASLTAMAQEVSRLL